MKCYKCNGACVTLYWNAGQILSGHAIRTGAKITHVNKACTVCEWMSYRTKVPGKLPKSSDN